MSVYLFIYLFILFHKVPLIFLHFLIYILIVIDCYFPNTFFFFLLYDLVTCEYILCLKMSLEVTSRNRIEIKGYLNFFL